MRNLLFTALLLSFTSCSNQDNPDLSRVPNITMLSGEAYVIYGLTKIKIDKTKKAGFNAYDLPQSFLVECIGECSFTVYGKTYNKSATIEVPASR